MKGGRPADRRTIGKNTETGRPGPPVLQDDRNLVERQTMEFWERAQTVHSRQAFVQFMDVLLADWRKEHESIQGKDEAETGSGDTLGRRCRCLAFLEAMRTRIADTTQLPSSFPYKELAEVMAASAGDERGRKELERRQEERLNCWEFKKCGREPGGEKVSGLGICPAATWEQHKGVHGGRYGGRICWALVGTLCGGQIQGVFAEKVNNCLRCDFYRYVREAEGKDFRYALPDRDGVHSDR